MKLKQFIKRILRIDGGGYERKISLAELSQKIQDQQVQIDFLTYELMKNMERHRWEEFKNADKSIIAQTKDSFDFQWENLQEGASLISDESFMNQIKETICRYLGGVDETSLKGKKVADVGCGLGRFTYGFLQMGCEVTAMDQSEHGLEDVKAVCKDYSDNLHIRQIDLLNSEEEAFEEQYDIVWCYGVVHHTGRTYVAMDNVCRMVKPGGLVFMMIYGFPDNAIRFKELTTYEQMRFETRNMSNEEKVEYLKKRFPDNMVHGYFDAISPQINDILSFGEIVRFMTLEGFTDVTRTLNNDNVHFVATKCLS